MKNKLIAVFPYTLLLSIFGFGGWYIYANYDRFASQAHFTWLNVSLLFLLNICTLLCESTRLRIQVKKIGHDLGQSGAWHMFTLMQAVNHMILKAGTFSGGYYLSKRFNISFNSYIAFLISYIVVMVFSSGALGLLVSIIYIFFGYSVDPMIPLFFILVIVITAVLILFTRINLPCKKLPKFIENFFSSLKFIYSDYRMLSLLVIVELFYYLFSALRFMVTVSMFSSHAGLLGSIVVVTVGNFLRVATIIPGGMGIAEVASGWTAGILGNDAGISGLSAGLDRLMYFVIVMIAGGIGFLTLSNRKEFKKPPEE
ncbi:MAG: lysylphosphatidylglycerol synthase domain-containing protein [Candidatus Latescibacterota bacterium]